MSFFRWSLCLRVRSMSPGPAPASPWPPQPRPGPPWTKLVLYLYICTVQYLMGNSATADLRGVVSSWPLKQPAPALWQNRLLCVTVHMYTEDLTLLSRRDCLEPACESPMLSQEKLVSRTETKPGSTQSWVSWNRQVNQTFCVWVSCEWYGVLINWKLCSHLTLRCVATSQPPPLKTLTSRLDNQFTPVKTFYRTSIPQCNNQHGPKTMTSLYFQGVMNFKIEPFIKRQKYTYRREKNSPGAILIIEYFPETKGFTIAITIFVAANNLSNSSAA